MTSKTRISPLVEQYSVNKRTLIRDNVKNFALDLYLEQIFKAKNYEALRRLLATSVSPEYLIRAVTFRDITAMEIILSEKESFEDQKEIDLWTAAINRCISIAILNKDAVIIKFFVSKWRPVTEPESYPIDFIKQIDAVDCPALIDALCGNVEPHLFIKVFYYDLTHLAMNSKKLNILHWLLKNKSASLNIDFLLEGAITDLGTVDVNKVELMFNADTFTTNTQLYNSFLDRAIYHNRTDILKLLATKKSYKNGKPTSANYRIIIPDEDPNSKSFNVRTTILDYPYYKRQNYVDAMTTYLANSKREDDVEILRMLSPVEHISSENNLSIHDSNDVRALLEIAIAVNAKQKVIDILTEQLTLYTRSNNPIREHIKYVEPSASLVLSPIALSPRANVSARSSKIVSPSQIIMSPLLTDTIQTTYDPVNNIEEIKEVISPRRVANNSPRFLQSEKEKVISPLQLTESPSLPYITTDTVGSSTALNTQQIMSSSAISPRASAVTRLFNSTSTNVSPSYSFI